MAQESILLDKALRFAARIVKLHAYLTKEKHEGVIYEVAIRENHDLFIPQGLIFQKSFARERGGFLLFPSSLFPCVFPEKRARIFGKEKGIVKKE